MWFYLCLKGSCCVGVGLPQTTVPRCHGTRVGFSARGRFLKRTAWLTYTGWPKLQTNEAAARLQPHSRHPCTKSIRCFPIERFFVCFPYLLSVSFLLLFLDLSCLALSCLALPCLVLLNQQFPCWSIIIWFLFLFAPLCLHLLQLLSCFLYLIRLLTDMATGCAE